MQNKDLRKKAGPCEVRQPLVIIVNECDGSHGRGPPDGQLQSLKAFVTELKFAQHFAASSEMDIGVQKAFEYVAACVLNSDTEYLQFTAP